MTKFAKIKKSNFVTIDTEAVARKSSESLLETCNLIKKRLRHRCFPNELCEIFKNM